MLRAGILRTSAPHGATSPHRRPALQRDLAFRRRLTPAPDRLETTAETGRLGITRTVAHNADTEEPA